MKVFHGIIEIAGQMGILAGALKEEGHEALGYNTFHSYLGYHNNLYNTDAGTIQKSFRAILNKYDIFNFHYAVTVWPDHRDLAAIKEKGKKVIMHHWGNDVRFHDIARINNPYVYTGDSPTNKEIRRKLKKLSQYISEAIVQDYEVYPYVSPYYKKVHVLPIAINLQQFQTYYPDTTKTRPLVLHAPTNPDFKGTQYIEKAISKLQPDYCFDYKRIEKMSHSQIVNLYKEADIIIDQILCGSYGLLSVESMALGKPVIAYIRPDLLQQFPSDLPIVQANPDNIAEVLRMLLLSPDLRNTIGQEGRKYVCKYHADNVVVQKLLSIYNNLS